jgi:cytosine/uracil/thiamine/allantoin permease
VIFYPEGNLLHKFLWTIVFCGFGMGAGGGALIVLLVSGRLWGRSAIIASAFISFVLLGLFCNFLCFNLDMHFNFFGAHDTPALFVWNGIIMSILGGTLIGWLCFTKKGNAILERNNL